MRGSFLFLAMGILISAAATTDAQVRQGGQAALTVIKPGGGKPDCSGGGKWPGPGISPPVHCPGPYHPNPWPCVPPRPGCWPQPPKCGGGPWRPPITMYPPIYVDGPYDTSLFNSWFAGWGAPIPYYDTDPVQYSYTPIDIPPRAPVVRPERTSAYSRILPRQVRRPLYERVQP